MRRLLSPAVLGLLLVACSTAALAAIPLGVGIDSGTIAGTTQTDSESRYGGRGPANKGAGLPSRLEFGTTGGKAQVLGDRVKTESSPTPSPDKLAFFDAAYQQQMQGGINP